MTIGMDEMVKRAMGQVAIGREDIPHDIQQPLRGLRDAFRRITMHEISDVEALHLLHIYEENRRANPVMHSEMSSKAEELISNDGPASAAHEYAMRELLQDSDVVFSPQQKVGVERILNASPKNKEELINWILLEIGMPTHVKGFRYVKEAILYVLENGPETSMTKELYPKIASQNNITQWDRVERVIRHAIEITWSKLPAKVPNNPNLATDLVYKIFGSSISAEKGRPVNSEFIRAIVNFITVSKLEEKTA